MILTCKQCQIEFKSYNPNRLFHNRRCYGDWRRGRTFQTQAITEKTCEHCGKPYRVGGRSGKRRNSRYCGSECAGKAREKPREKCKHCGEPRPLRSKAFCDRDCYTAFREAHAKGGEWFTCARCGKRKQAYGAKKRKYCDHECRAASRVYKIGPDHPLYGGGCEVKGGYIVERDYTRRLRDGKFAQRMQHRRVAEEKLGRSLKTAEHVHHLNGNPADNRPENLLVMSASRHRALHKFYAQEFQREHEAKGDLLRLTEDFLSDPR